MSVRVDESVGADIDGVDSVPPPSVVAEPKTVSAASR